MYCVCPAPLAVLLQLDFAFDKFLILARPVIRAAALLASQFYELILGHNAVHYTP